jgi:hypothetical protein
VVQVALPLVPADKDGVAAQVLHVAAVQRLVHVAHEVGQEHQALRPIIWMTHIPSSITYIICFYIYKTF